MDEVSGIVRMAHECGVAVQHHILSGGMEVVSAVKREG